MPSKPELENLLTEVSALKPTNQKAFLHQQELIRAVRLQLGLPAGQAPGRVRTVVPQAKPRS
jgi:hypothetical protein